MVFTCRMYRVCCTWSLSLLTHQTSRNSPINPPSAVNNTLKGISLITLFFFFDLWLVFIWTRLCCPLLSRSGCRANRALGYLPTTPATLYGNTTAHHSTYDHSSKKIRDPVCSPIVKLRSAGLVVGSVTTSESPVLYVLFFVFAFALSCCCPILGR